MPLSFSFSTSGASRAAGAVVGLGLALVASPAAAYSYESPLSAPCHESITAHAWRAVRAGARTRDVASPVPPDGELAALIDDLPFQVDRDMRDLGGASLLVGVRDNDLKGSAPLASLELAEIHGDPRTQREHCLRRPEHDEPEGSAAAIAECRAYIREMAVHAVRSGLDPSGRPDPTRTTIVPVYLAARQHVEAELPVLYVYLGNALHALQDSFTHAFRRDRAGGGSEITVVLNFADLVAAGHDERRDGPAHMVDMDACEGIDAFREGRLARAREASTDLLAAALDPALAGDDKERAIDAVLDKWLTYAPGCTFDNRWCDAPELRYRDAEGCRCSVPGTTAGGAAAMVAAAAALLALVSRRARTSRRTRTSGVAALLVALSAPNARAASPTWGATPRDPDERAAPAPGPVPGADVPSESPAPTTAEPPGARALVCVPGRQIACACPEGDSGAQVCSADGSGYGACEGCAVRGQLSDAAERQRAVRSRFGLHIGGSGALEDAAFAFAAGGRYRFDSRWIGGADIEANPWVSLETKRVRPGTLNLYLTLIRRFPVNEDIAIRTTAHAGVSVLLFDLYGAPSGSFGPYLGLNLIGLELALSRALRLVVDPADVVYALPHLSGVPLLYRQYRFTIGLQFGS